MDSLTRYLSLPITDHTWVFLIVLCVILLAPMALAKLRIPHLIGMILAGVLIGEHGFNLLERNDSFELFGQVGIYYIMFLAGLEMNLQGLRQNRRMSLAFGALTALIPFAAGFAAGRWMLRYSAEASLLLACILASHTLVSYPIVARYGLSRNRSVSVAVAATMVALLFALLVLAVLTSSVAGQGGAWFWLLFAAKFALFVAVLFLLFPKVIRRFFRKYSDPVMQYIFVIAMIFLAAVAAEAAGIDGILGAFLAGLVFNRFIPKSAPLMNRVEFVGNALFIPYFLIGVGMLVNLRPLFTSPAALAAVAVMLVVGTLTKYAAALIARRAFGMSRAGGLMMFGLTEAHAAGAIAIVMVGASIETAPGVPLMDNAVLDGVVVMILLSCVISSIATDQAARMLKLEQEAAPTEAERRTGDDEKILVPINDDEKIPALVQAAIMMRNPRLNRGLICLNVVNDDDTTGVLQRRSRECLALAVRVGAAADVKIQAQSRLAVNFVNGVVHAFRENDASELVVGLHHRQPGDSSLLGRLAQGLIERIERQVIIADFTVPINTVRRIVVAVPPNAQFETGFYRWVERLARLALEIGCRVAFHAHADTAPLIQAYMAHFHPLVRDEYKTADAETLLDELIPDTAPDHLVVLVGARRGTISYDRRMEKSQGDIVRRLDGRSLLIVIPDQEGGATDTPTFSEPRGRELPHTSRASAWLSKWMARIG